MTYQATSKGSEQTHLGDPRWDAEQTALTEHEPDPGVEDAEE